VIRDGEIGGRVQGAQVGGRVVPAEPRPTHVADPFLRRSYLSAGQDKKRFLDVLQHHNAARRWTILAHA
jgi:hypothetical protein